MSEICPACSSSKLHSIGLDYSGPVITSDFLVLQDAALRPFVCEGCGLVFESRGVRQASQKFYAETFRPKPMMKVYDSKGPISRPTKANALIAEIMPDLPPDGRLLEIGSGKGDFLSQFYREHPGWECIGIEPSVLYDSLKSVIGVTVFHGGYEALRCRPASQDLVVSLGVIEHVDDPLAFMRWIAEVLRPEGVHGRPISGPHAIKELGIRHVALSMSPRYIPAVAERLKTMGVEVYH